MLYILKTTACLFIFWAFYQLVLEKEKMALFNRFYLLGSFLLSLLIPFITIDLDSVATNNGAQLVEFLNHQMTPIAQMSVSWNGQELFFWLYGSITLLFLIRFIRHIRHFLIKTNKGKMLKKECGYLVLMPIPIIPHAFFQYVFVNEQDYKDGKIDAALLLHEFTHVKQWHSLDLLLIELAGVFFWFNPMIYAYKKAIRLNHEFLADEAALKEYKDIANYQNLLLSLTSAHAITTHLFANSFDYAITKKRLKMMGQKTTASRSLFKGGLAILLTVLPLFIFSSKVYCKLPYVLDKENLKELDLKTKKQEDKSKCPLLSQSTTVLSKIF